MASLILLQISFEKSIELSHLLVIVGEVKANKENKEMNMDILILLAIFLLISVIMKKIFYPINSF
jgi:hypothetical protein